MTKTDFFRVVIKIFGIYCFINTLLQLVPSLSITWGFDSFTFVYNSVYILAMVLIAALLLFRTDILIKLFRIDKGFDNDKIETRDLNSQGLFKFGLITIGLFMIVNNIAQFLNYCYLAFKKQVSAYGLGEIEGAMLDQHLDYNWWVSSGLNVLIGIIILTNYKRISKQFVKKEKNAG